MSNLNEDDLFEDRPFTMPNFVQYSIYTTIFISVAALFYALVWKTQVSLPVYAALVGVFILGVALCLIALSIMQKHHINLKYRDVTVTETDNGIFRLVGITRFLGQQEELFTLNMNEVSSLNLHFEVHNIPSHRITLWDEDPDLELTYFGLEQHNLQAKIVFSYPVHELKKDKKLAEALRNLFQQQLETKNITTDVNLADWTRLKSAKNEGVQMLDTGIIVWGTQRKESS